MDVNFQTPPLYPPILAKSLPLDQSENYKEILDIKKKFRNAMQESVYYVENLRSEKADFNASIERFSDKYSKMKKADINKWKPDWSRLPKELKYFYEKDEKKVKRKIAVSKSTKAKTKKINDIDVDKITEILKDDEEEEVEENEENEETVKEKKKDKESGDEEENPQEEFEDEEDIEEENDYVDTYFNNGEDDNDDDYGGGDDDGPTY